VKRVGGAIGEGASVVAQLHSFLAAQDQAADEAAHLHLLPGCRHRRAEAAEPRAA
jgi:uncharacterized NAD-dependent epimerase/dehydratase family protein